MGEMMRIIKIFIPFLFFVFNAMAQDCAQEYGKINKQCVSSHQGNWNSDSFELKNLKIGDAIFYQTDLGEFGKLYVRGVEVNDQECNLFFDSETFHRDRSYIHSTSISIKNSLGIWDTKDLNLDKGGEKKDILLQRYEGKCYLSPAVGKWVKYKNYDDSEVISRSFLLFVGAVGFIGIAVFLVAQNIFKEEEEFKMGESLQDSGSNDKDKKKESLGFVLKISKPLYKRYFSPIAERMKRNKEVKDSYKRLLANAGLSKEMTPDDFFAWKLLLIVFFPALYLGVRAFLEADFPLSYTPIFSILGYVYPDIWIRSVIERRKREIELSMPFIVDMLALSVEAGMDFLAAISRIMEKSKPGPLVTEFEVLIRETRIGSSRAEALRQLSWRVNTSSINSFCATLIAADSVGASISPLLKTLSNEIRQKRSNQIEQVVAKATPKVIMVLVMFIVPAVVCIIGGSFLVDFLG